MASLNQSQYEAAAALLAQQLAQYQAAEEAARQQMLEQTSNYYNNIYASLDQNYQAQLAAAQADFEAAMAGLQRGYDANVGTVNADTAKSLQQAYISHMMNQKNLGQQLAALGRSGGASETALLGLYNQYGQNRGTLEDTRNRQLNQLALQLAQDQADQTAAYNQTKTGYATDYTNQKNAYQQAQAKAIADWEADSLARMQGYRQDYNTQLNALSQQRAASSGGSSSGRTSSKKSSSGKTASGAVSAGLLAGTTAAGVLNQQNRWAAQRAANNNKKLAALDWRDSH